VSEALVASGTVLWGRNQDALFSELLSVGLLPRPVLRKILGNLLGYLFAVVPTGGTLLLHRLKVPSEGAI